MGHRDITAAGWVDFIAARLNSDEHLAQSADRAVADKLGDQAWMREWVWGYSVHGLSGGLINRQGQRLALTQTPDAALINTFSPDRVAAQADVLRHLLAAYSNDLATLMVLADIWATHPDHPARAVSDARDIANPATERGHR